MESIPEKIVLNRIRCKVCQDVIISQYRHHFVSCTCGSVACDGGRDYLRRIGSGPMEEQSIIARCYRRTNGLLVTAYQSEIAIYCRSYDGAETLARPGDWVTYEPEGGARAWSEDDFSDTHLLVAPADR